MNFGLQIYFDFGEGVFDGADAIKATGGGDHLVDEVALDVVGPGEAVEVAEGVRIKTSGFSLESRTIWPVIRLWRIRFLEDLALLSGVTGPLDLAPFVFELSFVYQFA